MPIIDMAHDISIVVRVGSHQVSLHGAKNPLWGVNLLLVSKERTNFSFKVEKTDPRDILVHLNERHRISECQNGVLSFPFLWLKPHVVDIGRRPRFERNCIKTTGWGFSAVEVTERENPGFRHSQVAEEQL